MHTCRPYTCMRIGLCQHAACMPICGMYLHMPYAYICLGMCVLHTRMLQAYISLLYRIPTAPLKDIIGFYFNKNVKNKIKPIFSFKLFLLLYLVIYICLFQF